MTNTQIIESKVGDYIRANKLSKKDAMKPEHFKQIKKLIKQGDTVTKHAIETVFNGKEKPTTGKTTTKKGKKTTSSKGSKDTGTTGSDDKTGSSSSEPEEAPSGDKDDNASENADGEKSKSGDELSSEQKEEVKDAVADTKMNLPDADTARKNAEQNPIKGYSLSRKMYFVHVGAKKKTEEAIKKYLQKANAGEINIKVTNTAIDSTEHTFDTSAEKYIIGVHVILDKTNVAGLRKLMAILKESKQIDEGIWDGVKSMFGRIKQGVKDGVNDIKKEAQQKIDATNEKMKELIGVFAIKAYITHFVGKRVGDQIDASEVYAGINESGKMKGRISYYTAITLK